MTDSWYRRDKNCSKMSKSKDNASSICVYISTHCSTIINYRTVQMYELSTSREF
jgi:hypothetical protein